MYHSAVKSLSKLSDQIHRELASDNRDAALKRVFAYVERVITEPICTAQVFGSKKLDELCQKIGQHNLSNLTSEGHGAIVDDTVSHKSVYIVTKLQKSGGHTRVIEDFINSCPDSHHVILSTELIGRSDREYLESGIVANSNVLFEAAPRGNYQKKLSWLQSYLLNNKISRIYLFNHHQDSVAVAAVQPGMCTIAYFYHHGDHHLCLGVYLSHLIHIDPHPMGYDNCRNTLGIDNIYIPLVVEDKTPRPASLRFKQDEHLITCTAAKSNKIEIPYYVSYVETIPSLLAATGGRHIHIGRLTPWTLFKIRRGMKKYGLPSDRFVYIPWVPSVWDALLEYNVDLYVASFPYGGGLTLIEAMGAGVPVILHKHFFSSVLSSIELAYPEVMYWSDPDRLFEQCTALDHEALTKHGQLGRLQYENFHRKELLENALNKNEYKSKPLDHRGNYELSKDEWANWIVQQFSFSAIIRRGIYRLYRKVRAWI